jgi:hypothetical protein
MVYDALALDYSAIRIGVRQVRVPGVQIQVPVADEHAESFSLFLPIVSLRLERSQKSFPDIFYRYQLSPLYFIFVSRVRREYE